MIPVLHLDVLCVNIKTLMSKEVYECVMMDSGPIQTLLNDLHVIVCAKSVILKSAKCELILMQLLTDLHESDRTGTIPIPMLFPALHVIHLALNVHPKSAYTVV